MTKFFAHMRQIRLRLCSRLNRHQNRLDILFLRIIGRISFPLFAYMIAEGCRYTRSKRKYLLTVLFFALACQGGYYLFSRSLEMCVFVTFFFSILLILLLTEVKNAVYAKAPPLRLALWSLAFLLSLAFSLWFCRLLDVDYDFVGLLLPVLISLPHPPSGAPSRETHSASMLMLVLGLLLLALYYGGIQWWGFLSVPFLLLYNGNRGRYRMKYFFYIFYPAHLVLLEGIALLLGR